MIYKNKTYTKVTDLVEGELIELLDHNKSYGVSYEDTLKDLVDIGEFVGLYTKGCYYIL